MVEIKVKKTPKSAFNPKRPISALLRSQIALLQVAVADTIKTEGEAAAYIHELTECLHGHHPHTTPRSHKATSKKRPAARKSKRPAQKRSRKATR